MEIEIDFDKFKQWVREKDLEISLSNLKKEIAELKGVCLKLIRGESEINQRINKLQSELRTSVRTELRTEPEPFEVKLLKSIKKSKPELIKQTILEFIEGDMKTKDMEEKIVREKKLCGKAQFYHYLSLLRTELRTGLRSKIKIEQMSE